MNQHWQNYWRALRRYAPYFPLGLIVALLPFLLNLPEARAQNAVLTELLISLALGAVISAVTMFFFCAAYAILTWSATQTGRFRQPGFLFHVLLGVAGSLAGLWLGLGVKNYWLGQPQEGPPLLPVLVFSVTVATGFTLFFSYQEAKAEALALRATAAEARYHTLATQMRPHFLFNALNNLAELIEAGQENAAATTYKLADLYRQILANSQLKTAPLSAEIAIARAYLELEQLRFGARLSFAINVDEAQNKLYAPSLLLQTLVENAVKHGVAPALDGGRITIDLQQQAAGLYQLRVSNTGAPLKHNSKNNGVGLANTRARLELLYGNHHQFRLRSDEQGRTVASFFFTGEKID